MAGSLLSLTKAGGGAPSQEPLFFLLLRVRAAPGLQTTAILRRISRPVGNLLRLGPGRRLRPRPSQAATWSRRRRRHLHRGPAGGAADGGLRSSTEAARLALPKASLESARAYPGRRLWRDTGGYGDRNRDQPQDPGERGSLGKGGRAWRPPRTHAAPLRHVRP